MAATVRPLLSSVAAAPGYIRALHLVESGLAGVRRSPLIVAAVAAVAGGAVAEGRLWAHHPVLTSTNLLATTTFVVTGLILGEDRDQRGTAWAVALAGITLPLGWLNQWQAGPLPLYSVACGYLSDIFGAWATLRYPETHLSRRYRPFCAILAGWLTAGPLFLACISRPAWWGFRASVWWPALWPDRAVFDPAQYVVGGVAGVLAGAFLVVLASRLLSASRPDRLILLPVITAAMIAGLAAGVVVIATAIQGANDQLFTIEAAAQLAVPVGFLVSIMQQRLVRMTHLVTALHSSVPEAEILRQVLRVSLRSSDLDLLAWSPSDEAYRTVDGHPASTGPYPAGRTVHEVTGRDGEPLAILIADRSAFRDRSLAATATTLSRLVLENVQLSHRLLAADYDARERLVSDLHDGVQNKLCGLRTAVLSAMTTADPAMRESLSQVSQRVGDVLRELRDLTHDVYPYALARLGLRAAVEDAARHLDLPADISIPRGPLPRAAERSLYFMICEALTNIYRHACASTVQVTVTRKGDAAEAVISDDGEGGADPRGSGLTRMRDRAKAHGGVLNIDSSPGAGTTLTMRIPCV